MRPIVPRIVLREREREREEEEEEEEEEGGNQV
jgi:hypothetical protein